MHRETSLYRAEPSPGGVRITIKRKAHYPKSRVVRLPSNIRYLQSLSDAEFDASCCLEFGIGLFSTK